MAEAIHVRLMNAGLSVLWRAHDARGSDIFLPCICAIPDTDATKSSGVYSPRPHTVRTQNGCQPSGRQYEASPNH